MPSTSETVVETAPETTDVAPAVDNQMEALAQELMGETTPEVIEEDNPADEEVKDQANEELEVESPKVDEVATPEADVEEPEVIKPDETKRNQAFAEMRVENKRLGKLLSDAAKASGLSVPEYEAKLAADALQAEATKAEVPVEVMARIKELEERDAAREEDMRIVNFQHAVNTFQAKNNLSQDDLRTFVSTCLENGVDPMVTNVPLDILYRGFQHEALVEKERQTWISKDSHNRTESTNPGSIKGKNPKPEQSKKIDTMDELEKVMAGMNS